MSAIAGDDGAADREPGLPARARNPVARIVRILVFFGRRHPRPFVKGCLAALLMVGARIAMPWPVHMLMHYWKLGSEGQAPPAKFGFLGIDGSVVLGLAFLVTLTTMGFADGMLRLQFARFSIGTIRDMRSAALAAALRAMGPAGGRPGDLVARLVGDTARVKAGLKGFLVHVAPNGALYVGVTAILLFLNVRLGLVFGAAGLGAAIATLLGARGMYRKSGKYRKKEGKLADRIDRALRSRSVEPGFGTANRSSGHHEAAMTRIQSLTTGSVYVVYGLAILGAVWIGTREIVAGALEPRDMVMFLMYALIIRGPTVRLARQGSRLGKTLATANRVVKVLYREPSESPPIGPALLPWPPGGQAVRQDIP